MFSCLYVCYVCIYLYIYLSPCISRRVVAQAQEILVGTSLLSWTFVLDGTFEQIGIWVVHNRCVCASACAVADTHRMIACNVCLCIMGLHTCISTWAVANGHCMVFCQFFQSRNVREQSVWACTSQIHHMRMHTCRDMCTHYMGHSVSMLHHLTSASS